MKRTKHVERRPSSPEIESKKSSHSRAEEACGGQSSGMPTPLDVVLRWVLVPGNYQRWRQERAHEILAAMESDGIVDQDAAGVRDLITMAEKQYASASKWLAKKSLRTEDLVHGRTNDKVQANKAVLKLCPRYFDVAPVFREFNFEQEAPRRSASCDSSTGDEFVDKGESADDDPRVVVSKRKKTILDEEEKRPSKRHSQRKEKREENHPREQHPRARASVAEQVLLQELTSQATPGILNCTRRTTAYESVLSGTFSSITELKLARSTSAWGASAQASQMPAYERQLAKRKMDYELKNTQGSFEAEQRKRELSVEAEQHRVEAEKWRTEAERWRTESAKTQVETEQVRAKADRRRVEMALRVDGAKSRQDLLARGIPLEMVDLIIPL
jgi:hypothetical protein